MCQFTDQEIAWKVLAPSDGNSDFEDNTPATVQLSERETEGSVGGMFISIW